MKRPLVALALIPLGLWAIVALPETLASKPGFWEWRRALVYLSGILALWWMSAGMILAGRPDWLEKRLGGLDKLFRLHRDIGIGAGTLVFMHWMSEWLPKNLAPFGWFPERVRGPRVPKAWWVDLAKDVGEWAGYILLALVVIALIRRIPYRWFRLLHKAFGVVFVAGAFHGLVLMPNTFWQQPLGWLTAALAAAGLVVAVFSLSNRIGRRHQYPATIERLGRHEDGVLEIICRPLVRWPGHNAGQFLFANFRQQGEGAHPFTIASAWNEKEGTLCLAIKALGHLTAKLPELLAPGQQIMLEGPYGTFDFCAKNAVDRSNAPVAQVWVAGGIGITPFLAQLNQRADQKQTQPVVDLFYCTREPSGFPDNLDDICHAAGVRLHRRATGRDGPLEPAAVATCLKPGSTVWFCGPSAWGTALADTLINNGLPRSAFHREVFEFR